MTLDPNDEMLRATRESQGQPMEGHPMKGLEALARAYDREDASQRGEPDPWDYDDGNEAETLWRAERIACAEVSLRAYIASQEDTAPSEADYALRHYDPVRVALEMQEARAMEEDREEDHLYWRHEIKALDEARNSVRSALASPAPIAPVEVSVKGLTLGDLQRAHIERQEEWCPEQKPDLSFRGNEMAGEVGEACNVIKKLERERHGGADRT